jgi:hypothetical protein
VYSLTIRSVLSLKMFHKLHNLYYRIITGAYYYFFWLHGSTLGRKLWFIAFAVFSFSKFNLFSFLKSKKKIFSEENSTIYYRIISGTYFYYFWLHGCTSAVESFGLLLLRSFPGLNTITIINVIIIS